MRAIPTGPTGVGASAARVAPPRESSVVGEAAALRVPDIYCPFPSAMHADAAQIEERTISWMRRWGYIAEAAEEDQARDSRYGLLAALVHPYGNLEATVAASKWMVWFFLSDDQYVERAGETNQPDLYARHALRTVRILHDPHDAPDDAETYLLALRELRLQIQHLAADEQIRRIASGVPEYLMSTACEAGYRIQNQTPELADYMSIREPSTMFRGMCSVFVEVVGRYVMPACLLARPDVFAVTRSAATVISYVNDMTSGLRELAWPGAVNLITVLADRHGCDYAEALEHANDLNTAETKNFVRAADRLRQEHNPLIDEYLTGLERWIRGNLDWSMATGRYHVDDPETASSTQNA
ncbi:MAG: terpene synthase family protein [Stackebrandtia sp.]